MASEAPELDEDAMHQLDALYEHLDELGLEPDLDEKNLEVALSPCRFHTLVAEQGHAVCRVHEGLIRDVLNRAEGPLEVDRPDRAVLQRMHRHTDGDRGLAGDDRHRREREDRTRREQCGRGIGPRRAKRDGAFEADESADEPEHHERRVQFGQPRADDRQRDAHEQQPRDEAQHEQPRGGDHQQRARPGAAARGGVHTPTVGPWARRRAQDDRGYLRRLAPAATAPGRTRRHRRARGCG